MINHARTLLLNHATKDLVCDWDQYVPGSFVSQMLPDYLKSVWEVLFGKNPDSWMMNWRAQQYMEILGSSEFYSYVTALDRRLSYNMPMPPITDTLPRMAMQSSNTGGYEILSGVPKDDPVNGRLGRVIRMSSDGMVFTVTNEYGNTITYDPAVDSAGIKLGDSGVSVSFKDGFSIATDWWTFDMLSAPSKNLVEVVYEIQNLPQEQVAKLFGSTAPFDSFSMLWYQNRAWPLKLTGLLLAWIYRAEEARNV
jgi:hypothetical protein